MIIFSSEINGKPVQCFIHYTPDDDWPPSNFTPLSSYGDIYDDLTRRQEHWGLPGVSEEKCKRLLEDIESDMVYYWTEKIKRFYKLYHIKDPEIPKNAQPFISDEKPTEDSFPVFDNFYREGKKRYGLTDREFKSALHDIHNGEIYFQIFPADAPNLSEDAIPLCDIPPWEHNRIKKELTDRWNKYELEDNSPENSDDLTMGDVLKIPGILFNTISSLFNIRPSIPTFGGAMKFITLLLMGSAVAQGLAPKDGFNNFEADTAPCPDSDNSLVPFAPTCSLNKTASIGDDACSQVAEPQTTHIHPSTTVQTPAYITDISYPLLPEKYEIINSVPELLEHSEELGIKRITNNYERSPFVETLLNLPSVETGLSFILAGALLNTIDRVLDLAFSETDDRGRSIFGYSIRNRFQLVFTCSSVNLVTSFIQYIRGKPASSFLLKTLLLLNLLPILTVIFEGLKQMMKLFKPLPLKKNFFLFIVSAFIGIGADKLSNLIDAEENNFNFLLSNFCKYAQWPFLFIVFIAALMPIHHGYYYWSRHNNRRRAEISNGDTEELSIEQRREENTQILLDEDCRGRVRCFKLTMTMIGFLFISAGGLMLMEAFPRLNLMENLPLSRDMFNFDFALSNGFTFYYNSFFAATGLFITDTVINDLSSRFKIIENIFNKLAYDPEDKSRSIFGYTNKNRHILLLSAFMLKICLYMKNGYFDTLLSRAQAPFNYAFVLLLLPGVCTAFNNCLKKLTNHESDLVDEARNLVEPGGQSRLMLDQKPIAKEKQTRDNSSRINQKTTSSQYGKKGSKKRSKRELLALVKNRRKKEAELQKLADELLKTPRPSPKKTSAHSSTKAGSLLGRHSMFRSNKGSVGITPKEEVKVKPVTLAELNNDFSRAQALLDIQTFGDHLSGIKDVLNCCLTYPDPESMNKKLKAQYGTFAKKRIELGDTYGNIKKSFETIKQSKYEINSKLAEINKASAQPKEKTLTGISARITKLNADIGSLKGSKKFLNSRYDGLTKAKARLDHVLPENYQRTAIPLEAFSDDESFEIQHNVPNPQSETLDHGAELLSLEEPVSSEPPTKTPSRYSSSSSALYRQPARRKPRGTRRAQSTQHVNSPSQGDKRNPSHSAPTSRCQIL